MNQLSFQVQGAEVMPFAIAPTIALKLQVRNADRVQPVYNVLLRVQIQIEAARRTYSAAEQRRLFDLFGEPKRWGQTLRSMVWTHTNVVVPAFTAETVIDLPVPCSFDFNIAATKYFAGCSDGEVPLCLLFSGTIFYEGSDRLLQVAQIPWEQEAAYRLPISVWRAMMDSYYPNQNWLTLRRDVFDRLDTYKREHGIPTWEQMFERLLAGNEPAEKIAFVARTAS